MIIKGLCRRYERWNPVHPTSGAFWGMGIGIGCGVGWGPGFGPEAIGYVGAGCGVGFSVGITFVGFGIGLPANYLFQVPYNAILATRSGALAIARSNGLLSAKDVAGEGWNNVASRAYLLQRETSGRLSSFNKKVFLDNGVDLVDMKSKLSANAGSLSKVLETFSSRFFPPGKVLWGLGSLVSGGFSDKSWIDGERLYGLLGKLKSNPFWSSKSSMIKAGLSLRLRVQKIDMTECSTFIYVEKIVVSVRQNENTDAVNYC
ncbi:unnamed protein product [Dovyalis caffra]|uniref:Cadmium-induced protein AS8 n=1 Tax=Dovyalis caffra TaxID=77055 RepID=A0AAV1SPU0_9ROSI|nr:unnamed protein product [Dovyalis caffra]